MPHATLHIIQKSRQICKVRQYAQCGEHRTSLEEKITLPLLKSTAAAAGAGACSAPPVEAVKKNLSAAGFFGRVSLRDESERLQRRER